jgi:hypothetical protein
VSPWVNVWASPRPTGTVLPMAGFLPPLPLPLRPLQLPLQPKRALPLPLLLLLFLLDPLAPTAPAAGRMATHALASNVESAAASTDGAVPPVTTAARAAILCSEGAATAVYRRLLRSPLRPLLALALRRPPRQLPLLKLRLRLLLPLFLLDPLAPTAPAAERMATPALALNVETAVARTDIAEPLKLIAAKAAIPCSESAADLPARAQ